MYDEDGVFMGEDRFFKSIQVGRVLGSIAYVASLSTLILLSVYHLFI